MNTFSDQLFLQDKYIFSTATDLEELLLENKKLVGWSMYFFEANSSSKQLLFQKKNVFRSRYFLRTVTFSEKVNLRTAS